MRGTSLSSVVVMLSFLHEILAFNSLRLDNEFRADSKAAQDLMASSRLLEDYGMSTDFLSQYSIKFQNCHQVSQWNSEYLNSDKTKIKVKRLVRFRMCPISGCHNNKASGCSSKYGDFIVDINTFVYYYLLAKKQQDIYTCKSYQYQCADKCYDDDNEGCEQKCYSQYGVSDVCDEENDDGNYDDGNNDDDGSNSGGEVDPVDYAQCAAYDGFGNGNYYIGPYCAEESSNIHLGVFSDDSCTTFSSCDDSCFYEQMGFALPYSDESLVSTDCVSCSDGLANSIYYTAPLEACESLYSDSGKCETKMDIDVANESACSYIEGMKFIREDGVISSTVRKSKIAAMTIGLSSVCAVLLGFYVHVLHTKLSRARFNLSSASSGAVL